jgi:hypothetical protein
LGDVPNVELARVISTATGSVIDSTDIGLGDGPTGIAFV